MTRVLRWSTLLIAATTLLVVLTAPALSQERATLVNPREKAPEAEEAEPEEAPAEPAPAEPEPEPAPTEAAEPEAAEPEPAEPEAAEAETEPAPAEPAPASAEPEPARAASEPEPAPAEPEPAPVRAEPVEPAASSRAEATAEPESEATAQPSDRGASPAEAPAMTVVTEPEPAPAPEPAEADRRTAPTAAAEPGTEPDRYPERPVDVVTETITVTEVLLDVLVTDRTGEVVTGLGPEDFVVTENGEEKQVTDVIFYGTPAELKAPGVEGETRSDRYFILLFHDQKQILPQLTSAQMDAGRWTRRWVEEELLPNDQVAVLGYDVKLKIYQDFTRDKEEILAAVDDAALGKKAPDHFKTRSAPELDPNSPSLLLNLPTGNALSRETRKLQEALALIGRAAEGIVGRKNLMLFSLGYGDLFAEFGQWTPDPRYYPDMVESLNAGNVAVYAIDWLGTRRGSVFGAAVNDSLSAIASATGGHYYYNFANVTAPLKAVANDNLGYYLVSYKSEYPTGDAGYRDVKVDTVDSSYNVRARKGYRYGTN